MFKLTVEQGEPAGAVFELLEGESVIGRSSSAKFRVAAADVSGQHLRIVVRKGRIVAENLSRYNTLLDGTPIQGPTALTAGQRITLGKDTVLRLDSDQPTEESGEAATGAGEQAGDATGAAPAHDARTGMDRTGAAAGAADHHAEALSSPGSWAADEGATRAMMTRAAGQEEIAYLRQSDQQRVRGRALGIGIAVFVAVAVTLFFVTRRPPPELVVSWPVDADGEPIAETVNSPLGGFTVSYPVTDDAEVQTMAGGFVITCSLGQRRDLRLRIILEEAVDDRFAQEALETSIARWREETSALGSKWNIDPPLPIHLFLGDENGVPFKTLPYQRHDEESWAGVANILRHGRRFIVLRAEVPASDRARAEELLYTPFILLERDFERSHWEGEAGLPSASLADILSRAHEEQRRLAPATWDSVEQLLIGGLRKSVSEQKAEEEADALGMLTALRAKKSLWYNEQLVQKEAALAQGDADRVRRIAEFCKAVFSETTDQRFYEVRKW
ncbi:MAG TPA: FHA domain-containing protein [Kiritimatiellia bacterium]|jgi:hypothetical protein